MRYYSLSLGVLALIFFSVSCSTMDTSAVKKVDKAAVGLIVVDKHLNYTEDFEAAQLVQRLAQSDKFDLKPIAKRLHEKTFGSYTEVMPFTLIPEDQVVESDRYQNFTMYDSDFKEGNYTSELFLITLDKYKAYPPEMEKSKRAKLFKAMPDEAGAMLMVDLSYKLFQENSMLPGVNKGKIEAKLSMYLVNSEGERILKINKKAESDDNMKVVLDAAILDPKKVQPLVQEATDKVMGKAEEFIQSNLSG